MAHIQVIPSPVFISVLKELSSLPNAPKAVKQFFSSQKSSKKLSAQGSGVAKKDSSSSQASIGLSSKDIRWCHTKIKERGIPHRIHKLLNDSEVLIPEYKPPARSPELEARIQKLKAEQANKEYREMTKNLVLDQYQAASLRGLGSEVKSLQVELREMNRQLITGLQYIISIVGTFFAVFVGLGYAINGVGPRVLFAVIGSMIVAFAELYFIIRQDLMEEDSKSKVS